MCNKEFYESLEQLEEDVKERAQRKKFYETLDQLAEDVNNHAREMDEGFQEIEKQRTAFMTRHNERMAALNKALEGLQSSSSKEEYDEIDRELAEIGADLDALLAD